MSADPFASIRSEAGIAACPFQGEEGAIILGYRELRKATQDWKTFSSDAPFRVPIPSEEDVRSVRQLPIEHDPPRHTAYRKLVEPWFKRPSKPEYRERLQKLVNRLLKEALEREHLDVVTEFALPLQSKALAILLNVPEEESDLWISWGTHVFHEGDGAAKGAELEAYLNAQFDRAAQEGSEDFFGVLSRCEYEDRRLTREELLGFGNLTFAGGRDTVINTISGILAHLATHREDLERLRQEPGLRPVAAEEFFRALSPITHIGRVCPHGADLNGHSVPADTRISLNFAAANTDPEVYPDGENVQIDRRPNPHVAFGSGPHNCLGATHARALVRCLLDSLCEQVQSIAIQEAIPKVEEEAVYRRNNGYHSLSLSFRTYTMK